MMTETINASAVLQFVDYIHREPYRRLSSLSLVNVGLGSVKFSVDYPILDNELEPGNRRRIGGPIAVLFYKSTDGLPGTLEVEEN